MKRCTGACAAHAAHQAIALKLIVCASKHRQGFRPSPWHYATESAVTLHLPPPEGFTFMRPHCLHADSSILPAAPFAFPEDAWLVGARQDLRQPNQSGPPTSLPLPDLPPSSLLSLCESDKANSSRSETHLWPAMSSVSNRSAALVGVTQDGPRVGAALALLLPALIAAVLLTAAAAVLIGFNPTMQHRPRNSTSSEKDEVCACAFSRRHRELAVSQAVVGGLALLVDRHAARIGAFPSCASLRGLYVCDNCDGWLAAWGLCGCMLSRFSTAWLLPFTLL